MAQRLPDSVSAIIPTVNRPSELIRAVTSALNQTHPVHEIIVVHDGHDARAVSGLARFKDDRIILVSTARPSGDAGATARNLGVATATAHWVALLDDDDEWLPDKLEKQLEVARRHQHCNHVVISGRVERRTPGEMSRYWPVRPIAEQERIGDYLFVRRQPGEGWLPTPTLMTTRELAVSVPFREGMKQHEDYDWLLNLEQRGARFFVCEEIVAIVHATSSGSMSNRATWEASLAWASSRRADLGDVAYSAFCLSEVSRRARRTPEFSAVAQIARAALDGRPRPYDIAKFAAHWILPARVVRVWRDSKDQASPSSVGKPPKVASRG